MTQNQPEQVPSDSNRINMDEAYDVAYWTKHFGITSTELKTCITKVGTAVDDVKKCLGK